MFAKLEGLEKKYMELEQALAQPDVYNDQDQYRKLTKAHADLRDVVELRFDQGFKVGEIADVLGVSRFAVNRRLNRALAELRRGLEGKDEA